MIKKWLLKIAINHFVKELENPSGLDSADRKEAYAYLYDNKMVVKVFKDTMIEDTKEMMKNDCNKSAFWRGFRQGAFVRTAITLKKAKSAQKELAKEEPGTLEDN